MDRDDAISRYAPMIYRLAYARTGNRTDAEDIMQEVFLHFLRAKPMLRDAEHGKAWFLRVAANCANDFFRSPWRKAQPLDETMPAPPEPELGGVLELVLALLPKYRVCVHLFYCEDMSVAEIAAATGAREGTVKTRLSRARDMLRDTLKGGDIHVEL